MVLIWSCLEKHLTPEQREELKKAGSLEELMKMLEERLREQHKKHQGGNQDDWYGRHITFWCFW